MADTSNHQDGACDIGSVLATARRLMRRGDGWEPENYDALRASCESIGIMGEPAITVALRKAFGEISKQDIHVREEPGYGGASANQTLYEARWQSSHCRRYMYVKFALFDDRLVLVRFHESTVVPIDTKAKKGAHS